MSELRTVEDVHCLDQNCDQATCCTECPAFLCPEHSNEFTTCAGNPDILHHVDCAPECPDCYGAGAQDAEAERLEHQREDQP